MAIINDDDYYYTRENNIRFNRFRILNFNERCKLQP